MGTSKRAGFFSGRLHHLLQWWIHLTSYNEWWNSIIWHSLCTRMMCALSAPANNIVYEYSFAPARICSPGSHYITFSTGGTQKTQVPTCRRSERHTLLYLARSKERRNTCRFLFWSSTRGRNSTGMVTMHVSFERAMLYTDRTQQHVISPRSRFFLTLLCRSLPGPTKPDSLSLRQKYTLFLDARLGCYELASLILVVRRCVCADRMCHVLYDDDSRACCVMFLGS